MIEAPHDDVLNSLELHAMSYGGNVKIRIYHVCKYIRESRERDRQLSEVSRLMSSLFIPEAPQ